MSLYFQATPNTTLLPLASPCSSFSSMISMVTPVSIGTLMMLMQSPLVFTDFPDYIA